MDARILRAAVVAATLCLACAWFSATASAEPDAQNLLAQAHAPVDINSASEGELRNLPGVGPARARAIVAGRPYAGNDDLVNRNIIPKNVYEGIRNRIVAKQP